jgi:hypothetical protein
LAFDEYLPERKPTVPRQIHKPDPGCLAYFRCTGTDVRGCYNPIGPWRARKISLELLNGSSDQAGFSDVFHFHEELPTLARDPHVKSKVNSASSDRRVFLPALEAGKWYLLKDVLESLSNLRF